MTDLLDVIPESRQSSRRRMISKNILIIISGILFITLSMKSVGAQEWRDGDGGKVKWQFDCDFFGYDIKNQQTTGDQCGSLCINTNGCSHFSYFEGVCYMKKAPSGITRQQKSGVICGFLTSGPVGQQIQYAIRAGRVPVRGVNLGGWLVVENWINSKDPLWYGVPSTVFSGGEMKTMRYLSHQVGDARFQTHWDTFITEKDIANIARGSLNTVRVPIGWWILGYDINDPSNQQEYKTFAPGGLYYLDRLVKEWAIKYNVAVLICIHAAKGSQNGNDHSSPADPGQVYWSQYPENIDNTIEVARFLADRYRATPSFLGVELLNEPTSVDVAKLKDYYIRAYNIVRKTGNDCILVTSPILREQYAGTSSRWENFMPSPSYTNVWHDWHKYLIWGFEDKPANWIMNEGVALIAADIAKWTGSPLIMGEWSLASAAGAKFTDVTLKQYANNMISKMSAMKAGWTMFTWKQEVGIPRPDGQGGWSMKDLIRDCIMNPKMWDSSSTLCP